jgi:hypothetical protein
MTARVYSMPTMLIVLAALVDTAAAQAVQPPRPVTAALLEQQVPGELESEGVVLSSLGLRLHIKQVANKWLVSLVEITTGRHVASTRIDNALPVDSDAAVAVMTNVVATFITQVTEDGHRPSTAPPGTPPVPLPEPTPHDERAAARQRQAEIAYQQRSLRFAAMYEIHDLHGEPFVQRRWLVLRGNADQELALPELYQVLGRADLVYEYNRRHQLMVAGFSVSVLSLMSAWVFGILAIETGSSCDTCSVTQQDLLWPFLISCGLSVAGFAFGSHYYSPRYLIDEHDARGLADAYNQRLRRELGLPPLATRPLIHDVALTPYVAARGGGLSLRMTF